MLASKIIELASRGPQALEDPGDSEAPDEPHDPPPSFEDENPTTHNMYVRLSVEDDVRARLHRLLIDPFFLKWLWESQDLAAVDFRGHDAEDLSCDSTVDDYFTCRTLSFLLLLEERWCRYQKNFATVEQFVA